ncbi:T-box transcription factor TBX6L-like, partial [Clarias magur]
SYLMLEAKPGAWRYHSAVLTDQSPEDICTNTIREKLLEYLPQEVPYTLTQHIELWRETADGNLDISVKLHVKKDSHMKMVIGPGGQLIARIAQEAGLDLTNAFIRMFPSCRVTVMGLNPRVKYVLMMDMVPFDNNKYKWNRDHWEVSGKSEPHLPNRFFIHPDSPALGERWMQYPISFHKLKLTNNAFNSKGLVMLHSMHKYQPRLHIVQAPDPCGGHSGGYLRFTFPEAGFIAVTSYQNQEITKLKIDNNPFAKGFRDNGLSRKRFRDKEMHQRSGSGKQQNRTENPQANLLDTDDEEDKQVSSSVESPGVLHLPDMKGAAEPFLPALTKCEGSHEGLSQSTISHQSQHTLNSKNRDSW